MSLDLKPILRLLSRPVVSAPLKGLEINTYLYQFHIFQVYSTGISFPEGPCLMNLFESSTIDLLIMNLLLKLLHNRTFAISNKQVS